MSIGNILWTCFFIWCIPNNEKKRLLSLLIKFYYNFDHFMQFYNHLIYPDYFSIECNKDSENTDQEQKQIDEPKKKYEDKYLDEIRKLSKEFQFNKEEEEIKEYKYIEFCKQINDSNAEKMEQLKNKLKKVEKKIQRIAKTIEDEVDEDEDRYWVLSEDSDDNDCLEETVKILQEEKVKIIDEMTVLQKQTDTEEGQNEVIQKARELSHEFVVNQRLEKINNCYIMEFTPLGNVLMMYDSSRSTFKYFSDNNIPYRYLEPVARKYVKCYNCRPIFVDMEEELKLAEEKWEKERKEKQEKEEEEKRKREELIHSNKPIENKKNVFAKFKSYNKDQATNKTMVAPPKNSIPNKALTKEQENEKILLKEKANRYTYEGKITNFSFLKKIDRKIVDKKYGMTFADFKKMHKK